MDLEFTPEQKKAMQDHVHHYFGSLCRYFALSGVELLGSMTPRELLFTYEIDSAPEPEKRNETWRDRPPML